MSRTSILGLLVIAGLGFMSAPPARAHEGDHGAPGVVEAPKGGEIKAIENVYVEVLAHDKEIKIYLYDKTLKPVTDVSGFTLSAEAQLPKSKVMQLLKLEQNGGIYSTTFDAKGAHRYNLVLKIRDGKLGHDDRLNFTLEPRR